MSRYSFKAFVVTLLSVLLLYYGVAWAVLRCAHHAGSDHEIAQHVDLNENDVHRLARHDVRADFECFGKDYHKESMAVSLSGSRLHWLTPDISPNMNNFLTLRMVKRDVANGFLPGTVFERLSSPYSLSGLPFYLSLSILRI